jgi:hypothetical protein
MRTGVTRILRGPGKLIQAKNLKTKTSCKTLFKNVPSPFLLTSQCFCLPHSTFLLAAAVLKGSLHASLRVNKPYWRVRFGEKIRV